MPKVKVYDMAGAAVGEMELEDSIFGIKPNKSILHAAVVNYLANQRQGTQSTKTRAEVSGGGRKPWRQKGTGRARQGSTRSPQWKHGGVALGPKPRSYRFSLNRKVRKIAMKSAFSAKVLDGGFIVVEKIALPEIKTKAVIKLLGDLGAAKTALIVTPASDNNVVRSARNIPGVTTAQVGALNVYDILKAEKMIIDKEAVNKLTEVYAQ
ncbi:MAG: 50S ribosomal protein L4 [Oscillospiraceae bacterium]|nr:50S ribosomal protein L4 [Oscillospiraceae bacterium]